MHTPTGPNECYALAARRHARYLSRFYDGKLASVGLSVSQFSILSYLEEHKLLKLLDLADMLVMERTSLVRALKPLQSAGWVIAERPTSGRSFDLRLSPAGIQKVEEAAPLWREAQAAFEEHAGRDTAVQLRGQILDLKYRE